MTPNMKRARARHARRPVLLFVLAAVLTAVLTAVGAMGGWNASIAQTPEAAGDSDFPRSRLTIETEIGRFDFTVEVANTWARRAQGLQHRRTLADDAGMLFDYAESRPVAMWMKNTHLPLDMLFIDATGTVTRVAPDTEPLSLTPIPSGGPVRAVLELNVGTARRLGIRPGDRVLHPIFDTPRN